jgi:multiple sugar transport system permease protein
MNLFRNAVVLRPVAARPNRGGRHRLRGRLVMVTAYVPAVAYAAALVVPLYYVLVSSFKTNQTIFQSPLAPPTSISFGTYEQAQRLGNLTGGLANSAILTIGAEIITLVLTVLAAYGIARIPSRLSTVVERFFGLGLLIPTFAILVPTYLLAVFSGLLNTRLFFLVLFYPSTVLPISVILLAQFMRTISREVEESAMIDGASRLGILWHVVLPLSRPGMAVVVILNFLAFWNEYIFALIITDQNSRTIQVALSFLRGPQVLDYALLAAGTVITLIPVYFVYGILQRRMQEAFVAGSVKG